jgi:HlyD family secretion protein
MMKWIRRIALFLLLAAIAGAIVGALLPDTVPVDVSRVTRGPFVVTVDEDGRTRVKDRFVVSAPLGGELARLELEPGDPVERGTVLARLAAPAAPLLDAKSRAEARARLAAAEDARRQAEAAVERARIAHDTAAREAARVASLGKSGIVAAQELDAAEAEASARARELDSARFGARVAAHQVEVIRAVLAPGRAAAEDLEIHSPVRGRVLRVLREDAGVVAAGTPLYEVGDPGAIEIVADVLTADAVMIRPGAPVAIERWGGPRPLAGRVRLVEPAAFTKISALGVEEQRVNVIIQLLDPPETWPALGDGFHVEVRIEIERSEDATRLPSSAVFRDGPAWAVLRLEGNRARVRQVALGRRAGLLVEATAGVTDGDLVIVHPSERVIDGTRVRPR